MKRLALLSLVLLFFTGHHHVSAQGLKEEYSLLWEISGNGLTAPSYLYGTLHLYDQRAFDFSDSVLLKFQQCSAFASELNMDSAFRNIIQYYLELDKSEARKIALATKRDSTSSSDGKDSSEIAGSEPVLPMQHRSVPVASSPRSRILPDIFFDRDDTWKPGDSPVMLDAYLHRLAKKEHKKVIGLEMVGEQLQALSHGNTVETNAFNLLNAKRLRKLAGQNPREMMIGWYHQGNVEKLQEFMWQNIPPTQYRRLIVQRNRNMVERSEQYIRHEPTFIAVGAGHLGGKDGMIRLYRKQGYTVRPVRVRRTGLAERYREPEYRAEWYRLASPEGAYSVEMPSEPVTMTEFHTAFGSFNHQPDSNLRLCYDAPGGIAYKAGYFDLQYEAELPNAQGAGLLPESLEQIYTDSRKVPPVRLAMNGMEGCEMTTVTDEGKVSRTRLFVRSNRLYMLQAETMPDLEKSDDIERFFASFETRELADIVLHPYVSKEARFTVFVPADPIVSLDTLLYLFDRIDHKFQATDPNSGDFFSVELHVLSEYFQARSEEKFYTDEIRSGPASGDSLVRIKPITFQGFPGRDMEFINPRSGCSRRIRCILNGNRLYILTVSASRDRIFSEPHTTFLDSFRLDDPPITADLYSDKAGKILEDIVSEHPGTRARAQRVLPDYDISPQHLRALHALLGQTARVADSASHEIGIMVLKKLTQLRDNSSTDAIRTLYPIFPRESHGLRTTALSLLATIGTEESVILFRKLILDSPPGPGESSTNPFFGFYDNVGACRPLYPEILRLLDRADYRYDLYWLTSAALDESVITSEDIAPYASTITDYLEMLQICQATRSCDDEQLEETDLIIGFAAGCASYLPATPKLQAVLTKLLSDDDRFLASHAALGLMRQGREVAPEVLDRIAADPTIRLPLYNGLRKADQLEQFPVAYLNQKSIAESYMMDWLARDYDYAPDSIEFLAEREVEVRGIRGRAFLFRFRYDDWGGVWRVGISGLQPLEVKDLAFTMGITWSDYRLLEKQSTNDLFIDLLGAIEAPAE